MTTQLTQITNLVKSKNEKIENICYKEVHKIKISKENDDSPIVFSRPTSFLQKSSGKG